MPYPQIVELIEAIQHPETAFLDPELKQGRVRENNLGLPLALSGGFALTYMLSTPRRRMAVRCFHREVPSAEKRYAVIAQKVKALHSGYFVDFDYQARGIKVRSEIFPIVKMDWVDGDTLGVFLDKSATNASQVRTLRSEFQALANYLEREGIAHGDIQNGNVIVANNRLKLIDYDGMYAPSLPLGQGSEIGHKHFQHNARSTSDYGPKMDRFSFIAVDLSLMALLENPALHRKYREGGETIIFKANDFADPDHSPVFQELFAKPSLKQHALNFAAICEGEISNIPSLEDFLAGRNIPKRAIAISQPSAKADAPTTRAKAYISAFTVISAQNFESMLNQAGNRVELVGCIQAIKTGVGKRGRGKDRPYVFLNFGPWLGNIIKITIWSEGLSQLAEHPSERWAGKWISVTGLVDPPYQGKHYAGHYTHVGITITDGSQINFINEKEARYRLGANNSVVRNETNQNILASILGSSPGTTTASVPSHPISASPQSANARILQGLKGRTVAPPPATAKKAYQQMRPLATPQSQQPSSGFLPRLPRWAWWLIVFVIYLVLLNLNGKR